MKDKEHKAGFVNIIGSPNAGKSTLMNRLVGQKLSGITSKAQTTRHRIMGIVNGDDFQIVYSDTPGVVDPSYKLHESMLHYVGAALEDADVLLIMVDVSKKRSRIREDLIKRIKDAGTPVIVLLNKIDLSDEGRVKELTEKWSELFPDGEVRAISAYHGFNVDPILDRVIELLPASPPFYPKDEVSDKPMKFFVAEIIREKILKLYQEEVPYSCEVVVNSFEDNADIVRIQADIVVMRTSQRSILLGQKGKAIKKLGTVARRDIQELLEKKVHLDLYVKVDKDWRDDPKKLRGYGYSV